MCDDGIRRILGDERVRKGEEFNRGVEAIQIKYADYFLNRALNQLSHYVVIHDDPTERTTVINIDTGLPQHIAREVLELFNSIFKR